MANRVRRNTVFVLAIAWLIPVMTAAPAAEQSTQQPTFRVAIDMVTLDVIPRGENGRFVPNLVADDFQVLEDAVPQKVASLVLVNGGRVFNLTLPASPATASPDGLVLPAARATADAGGRVFVLVVDDLHFTATETPVVRALLRKVIAKLFHDGDMVAMFSTGSSSIEIPVSYDRKLLESAVSKVAGHGMSYRDIMDAKDGSQGPQGLRYQAHVTFKTAYELLGNLERVRNRRKALILISNGYDFDPFPAGRTGTDQVFGGRYGSPWVNPENGDRFMALEQANNRFADADLASELAALTGAANRVNASIYAIDPRGVAGTTSAAEQIDMTEMRTHIGKTQASLQVLSEATGGFAVINDNTYDEALARIDAETSDYYILGYYSTNADATQRNRQVEVKATRPGIQVASRGWYRTKAQLGPSPRQ
jgi:VWFA-related protein